MQRRLGVGVVTAVAVASAAVAAAVSAHAAPTGAVDKTYSCRVRAERYVDLDATVTLPPNQGTPRPANLNIFTVKKTFNRNGFKFNLPQVIFQAAKDSLKVDGPVCRPSSRKVPLRPTGLPRRAETVTPSYLGTLDQRCVTTKRVLVHLRITPQGGVPAHALVAVRDDTRTRRAVEFVDWKPLRIKGWFGKTCVANGNG